ncbi:hypothetical protein D5086_021062 [Populus alba]|uniref:Uncharacterized protein n=1 Tax=Populus alba TaxID=43335 RepID=A0ACC4BNE8_POPAL
MFLYSNPQFKNKWLAADTMLENCSAINAGFYSRAGQAFFLESGVGQDLNVVNQSYEWVEKAIVLGQTLGTGNPSLEMDFWRLGLNHIPPILKLLFMQVWEESCWHSLLNIQGLGCQLFEWFIVIREDDITMRWCVKKVMLSAGAIGSPQLLLLSGIGQRSYLSSMGIPVAYHLPYVDPYLYDNPRNGISTVTPTPLEHSLIQVVGISEVGAYLAAASTVNPFASPARGVFIRTPLHLTVATLMEEIVGLLSIGSLGLVSTDVRVNPIVRVNYFSNPAGVEMCVNGTRKIWDVLKSGSITIWHYHGGCVVGKVVDRDYHLIGVGALRVVDGSTLTVSPGTNPQATLMKLER